VAARQLERLRAIAMAFLAARAAGGAEPACRFDVAEVTRSMDGLWSVRMHHAVQGGG
jgi:Holliday junction resolvase-like predicted endonuclease